MKICIILPRGFPPEIRVEKEARTLLKEGHELHLICIQKEYTQPLEELVQGIHVHRIKKPKRPFGKLSGLLTVEFFLNPIWTSKWENKIKEVIKEHGVDVLNVHDLPVAYTTIRTGKKYGIPIIFEMHENWPAALSAWGKSHIYDRLFMNVTLHKMLEKKCIKDADHILVVVDEQKKRLLKLNIPEKKITVVLNVEDINYFDKFLIDNALVSRYGGKFIISYIGGIGPHRGVDTAIKSMPTVLKKIPNAKLLVVGAKGGKYVDTLKVLCVKLGIAHIVEFIDWVPFDKVPSYIAVSHVCLVPHHRSEHTETTIPHKLFQYMVMKKPVIVTDVAPLKRIVADTKAGIVVLAGNPEKMSEAIVSLSSSERQRFFGEMGRKSAEKKYNWYFESKKLIRVYKKFAKHQKLKEHL